MRKLALVVGMSEYPEDKLANPVNDANSIEYAFRKLGIDTMKIVNTGVADLKDALDKFKEELKGYEGKEKGTYLIFSVFMIYCPHA